MIDVFVDVGRHRDHGAAGLGRVESGDGHHGRRRGQEHGHAGGEEPAGRPRIRASWAASRSRRSRAVHPILGRPAAAAAAPRRVGAGRARCSACSFASCSACRWPRRCCSAAAGPRRRADLALGLVPLPRDAARAHERAPASAITALAAARRHGVALGGARPALVASARARLGFEMPGADAGALFALLLGLGALGYLLVGDGALRAAGVRGVGGGGAARARVADRAARGRAARAARAGRSALSLQQPELDRRADRAPIREKARLMCQLLGDFLRDSLTLGGATRDSARPRGRARRAVPGRSNRCGSARGSAVTAVVSARRRRRAGAAADPAAARRERRAARHRDAARGRRHRDRGEPGRRARGDRGDAIRATRTAAGAAPGSVWTSCGGGWRRRSATARRWRSSRPPRRTASRSRCRWRSWPHEWRPTRVCGS